MCITKTTRKRGVILSATGWDKFQKVKRSFEFQDNDGSRYTLEELSSRTNLSLHTISRIIARVEGVDKLSLEYCFRAFGLKLDKNDYTRPSGAQTVDWGEAVDVSGFNGRSEELAQLQKWVLIERCRSVAVLGIGGIGKTSVAVKFAQQVQHEFDYVIWRSLFQAPPVDTLIADLVCFLSNQQETKGDIGRLMHYLRSSRCLLILDKMESVLDAGHAGHYRPRYEGYGELLRLVGETAHQSCLILTSREKPAEIAASEGTELSVRSLRLGGSQQAAFALLASKGLVGSEEQKQELCERYGNNPKALKIVASSIYNLFNGDIEEFL
ncbi:NB-ARC domain-containing protein, partial [Scytonema sp. PRP1]|uniref:NB-ARC domain-containing protein n=1 Tax=Scytonema sp. PRP1 TaxID=3120513 RepID=UPI002FD1F569